jgi:hypothetical protein
VKLAVARMRRVLRSCILLLVELIVGSADDKCGSAGFGKLFLSGCAITLIRGLTYFSPP